MAITHADLEEGRSYKALGSWFGTVAMSFAFSLGLLAFPLCILAEISTPQVKWTPIGRQMQQLHPHCIYTRSGTLSAWCASAALLMLACALALGHTYVCVTLCHPPKREVARPLHAWISATPASPGLYLGYKAAAFFMGSLASFAVAVVLHVTGIIVELGHMKDWDMPHASCLTVRKGMFTVAGVFTLVCTSLGSAFYTTALKTQKMEESQAAVRQEVVQVANFIPSSSSSFRHNHGSSVPLSLEREPHHPSSLPYLHACPHNNVFTKESLVTLYLHGFKTLAECEYPLTDQHLLQKINML